METRPTIAVVGLTGAFGGSLARELAAAGYPIRALVRSGKATDAQMGGHPITIIKGDATRDDDLEALMTGAEVLIWGLNVPYPQWPAIVPAASQLAFDIAAKLGVTVVFPGNVYGLGRAYYTASGPLEEDAPKIATSRKGRLRNEVEAMLEDATTRGARAILLRGGDFFGGADRGTWFSHMLAKVGKGGPILWPTDHEVIHAFAFMPDFVVAAAALIERRSELPPFAVFHFAGHNETEATFIHAVRAALGDPDRKVSAFPWGLLHIARPFSAMIRELYDVRYLWSETLTLDDAKLRSFLGSSLSSTPLDEAVAVGVKALGIERKL